jgi:hypothetical protein
MASPLLERKTRNKVQFVYSDRPDTMKIIEDLFNMDELESAFGGKNPATFNINDYAVRMREDDKKMPSFWSPENSALASEPYLMSNQKLHESSSSCVKAEETDPEKREETDTAPEKREELDTKSEKEEETQTKSSTVEQKSLPGEDTAPVEKSAQ